MIHLFHGLEKIGNPTRATLTKPNFQSFCELGKSELGKKFEVQPKSHIQKPQFLI